MDKKKTTLGRQKVKIARIESSTQRLVTFSKRRSGIFKKASELCTLCGIEMVVIVFSPSNHVYSFGSPDVGTLINRFLFQIDPTSASSSAAQPAAADRNKTGDPDLIEQLAGIEKLIEIQKLKGKELDEQLKDCGWNAPIDTLNIDQLLHLKKSLQGLREKLAEFQAKKTHAMALETEAAAARAITANDGYSNFFRVGGESSNASMTWEQIAGTGLMNPAPAPAPSPAPAPAPALSNINMLLDNYGGFNFHAPGFN